MSRPWQDESTLRELYVGRRMSMRKVADELGAHHETISRWLKKYDIDTRGRKESLRVERYKQPAHYFTGEGGYERARTKIDGEQKSVQIHRLVAVAEYGLEAVNDSVVHHKNRIPWDNRPGNLVVMEWGEHGEHHAYENESWENFDGHRPEEWERDNSGRFVQPKVRGGADE